MIELTFKYCIIGVALSFPVLNKKLLYTRLLLLERLQSDLLAVG
jgi:hypothetical protein